MKNELLKSLLAELDVLLMEAELGFTALDTIMDNLDRYTKDYVWITDVTHCPYICIFNALKEIRMVVDKGYEALQNGGVNIAQHE